MPEDGERVGSRMVSHHPKLDGMKGEVCAEC